MRLSADCQRCRIQRCRFDEPPDAIATAEGGGCRRSVLAAVGRLGRPRATLRGQDRQSAPIRRRGPARPTSRRVCPPCKSGARNAVIAYIPVETVGLPAWIDTETEAPMALLRQCLQELRTKNRESDATIGRSMQAEAGQRQRCLGPSLGSPGSRSQDETANVARRLPQS